MKQRSIRLIILLLVVGLAIVTLLIIANFVVLPKNIFGAHSYSCEYENHAWSHQKLTCVCIGIKVDTTNKLLSDSGESRGCIGLPLSHKCYTGEDYDGPWKKIDCGSFYKLDAPF